MKLKEFIETTHHEKHDWQRITIFINGMLIKEFKTYELYGNDAFQDYKIVRHGVTLLDGYCRYNVELEEVEANESGINYALESVKENCSKMVYELIKQKVKENPND